MERKSAVILCLAYIVGLLAASTLGTLSRASSLWVMAGICVALGGSGFVLAVVVPRWWQPILSRRVWMVAGVIAAIAVVYFQFRIPQPGSGNIATLVQENAFRRVVVEGRVLSVPQLNSSDKLRFWLEARRVDRTSEVRGKLYVTLPLLQGTGVYPTQEVAIAGTLYRPQAAQNPGAFDFRAYLARQGVFAGLSGQQVRLLESDRPLGWWQLRRRILQAEVRGLGSPLGQLVSSIVLGRRAVDLPNSVRDRFIKTGLAHVLAASGFHISLVLGVVLAVTRNLSGRTRLAIGLLTLAVYMGLTGLQPSVLRATIMGAGGLYALASDGKVYPLGSLLVAATLLLLFNPLWIEDIGFQLSFMATLGLIVTMKPLVERLDWLPMPIASAVAVPLAVFPWILPLQLFWFAFFPPYGIVTSIVTTPLVAVISLGGMASALAALIWPLAGTFLAGLLFYPTQLLMVILDFFANLPGSSLVLGKISAAQVVVCYVIIFLVWQRPRWRKHWRLAVGLAVALIMCPLLQLWLGLVQVTVLAANGGQAIVVQDRGQVALLGDVTPRNLRFTVEPFLRQQGINRLDWVLTPGDTSPLARSLSADKLVSLEGELREDNPLALGNGELRLLNSNPPILMLELLEHRWLILPQSLPLDEDISIAVPQPVDVLLWSGQPLASQWLDAWQPRTAIATAREIDEEVRELMAGRQIEFYWTGRDGALQWTPQEGFRGTGTVDALDRG